MTDNDKFIDEDDLDRRIRELGLDADGDEISAEVESAKAKGDKIDDEFASRLKALEDRAHAQKQIRENKKREENRRMESDRDSARGLGVGLSIAYTLIGLPLLGLAIGWYLDSGSGGQTYKGIGAVAGTALGIVMTVILLSRADRQP